MGIEVEHIEESTALSKISIAKQALAEAQSISEVLQIHDVATAMNAYATARGADDAAQMAIGIKLRAERKAGEFLQETELSKGAATPRTDNMSARHLPTLDDLNVSQKESSRWQRIASIPDEKFEEYLIKAPKKTQFGLLSLARRMEPKPEPVETPPFPEDTYRCIVIDPPWPTKKIDREVRPNQGIAFDYPPMPIKKIQALPITKLADPNGCHIYLWTTHKYFPTALTLFDTWGVKYQCVLTWVKNVGFTPFSWMYSTEHVLFGRIGSLKLLKQGTRLDFHAKVREHSRKPDIFYYIAQQASPERRLDMFSREPHEGFEQWGNEVDKF